jgi:hypothetical protein
VWITDGDSALLREGSHLLSDPMHENHPDIERAEHSDVEQDVLEVLVRD